MKKPLFGLLLGGLLGIFDGLTALVSAPETAPEIVGIVIGSSVKGLLTGFLIGLFETKVQSLALGVLFGGFVGLSLAGLVVLAGNPYVWQVMLPGTVLGVVVGYATHRHGRAKTAAA